VAGIVASALLEAIAYPTSELTAISVTALVRRSAWQQPSRKTLRRVESMHRF
jgi:hypothetical protein